MTARCESLRKCIEDVSSKNTDYKHPEQAVNQAESLKSLSSDLYTDNIRFIYELIQNADDAQAKNVTLTIVEEKYLIVAHDGKIFDEKDLEGLCGVNNGTKKKDLNKTGYKGLGFKAVFGKSNYVLIYSNGEYFRFDASHRLEWNRAWGSEDQQTWEKENDRHFIYPWQINPIWTDKLDIPNSITTFLAGKRPPRSVAYAILFHDTSDIDSSIKQLKQQPHMFLFLRHISQVTFSTGKINEKVSNVHDQVHDLKQILLDKSIDSQWIIKRYELDVPQSIRNKLSADTKAPEKLRSIRQVEIFFAAKYDCSEKDGIKKLDAQDSILFSYLPTKICEYKFPFLINGNFLTNVNREQIHTDSIWNQWLFEQIPRQIFQWIKELVHKNKFDTQAYRLIPSKLNLTNNSLAKEFNASLDEMIDHYPFIRNRNDQFLTVNQTILDKTSLSKHSTFINTDSMRDYLQSNNDRLFAEFPFVDYDENLEQIGVKVFTWKDCIVMFQSDLFLRTHTIENNKQLIRYFHQKHSELDLDIHQIPFLMDQQNHLQLIENIYFPRETLGENETEHVECFFLHPTICLWLNEKSQRTIKQWLQDLGVEERTDLTYLNKTIIPNAAHFSTNENTIRTIQTLFKLFQKTIITKNELEQLKRLKLLTTRRNLVAANRCFFSEQYKPRLVLEEFLKDKEDRFLSFDYVKESEDDLSEWRRFFLAFGVQEEFYPLVFRRKLTCYEATQHGFREPFLNAMSPDGKHRVDAFSELTTITFLPHTENSYEFSKFFWSFVIKNIKPEVFSAKVTAYWGHQYKSGAIDGTPLDDGNYIKWFVRNVKCIPTSELVCELASRVLTNSKEMKDLCGKYMHFPSISLPESKTPWNEIFNFKTKLTISDCLGLLEEIRKDEQSLKENLDRTQKIYNHILTGLSSWSNEEQKQVKTRMKSVHFLTENEQWRPASDLYLYLEGTNNCLNEAIPCLKLDYTNRRHPNLKEFLELFKIKRIGLNDLTLHDQKSSSAESFRKKLIEISPFLKKWMTNLSVSAETVSSIDRIIQQENEYIESSSLELFYRNEFVQKTNVYYDHKHKLLYVTRPWNSETAFINLPNKLCQLWDIQGFEDKLRFLLKGTIEEIRNHFQLNSIEIPNQNDIVFLQALPKLNVSQPPVSNSNKSIPQTKNQNITTVALPPPPPPTPLQFIPPPQSLQLIPPPSPPVQFIPLPQPIIPLHIRPSRPPVSTTVIPVQEEETQNIERISLSSITTANSALSSSLFDLTIEADQFDLLTGRIGEEIVYKSLIKEHLHSSIPVSVRWLNEKRESFLPYDIILILNGKSQYIEVKSTRTRNQHTFPLSINEIEFLSKERDNYFIYRVYINEEEFVILDNIRWRLMNKQQLQLNSFLSIMASETND